VASPLSRRPQSKLLKKYINVFLHSVDRPLGLQDVEAPRIHKKSAHESGKVISPLPPGDTPGTHLY